ncbi:18457_t:CDS:2 [Entrophospora sp. SA101]|nr:18457_t:CDS:2 [Entrophospora sp. SA101]
MATQISNNNSISSNMNNFERVLPTMPVIVKSPKISATAETSSTSSPPASSTSFPTTDSTDIITSTTRTTTSTAISPTIKSISNNNNKRKNLINPREKGNEDDGGKTIKKIKRVKDPNAPKRPANAYIQFVKAKREEIKNKKKQEDTIKLPTNEYELQDDNSKSIKRLIKNAQHAQTTDELLLAQLTIGGLKHPIISAVAGGVWIIGRIAYAVGYSTGEPDKRHRGGFGYFGSLALVGTTISSAYSLLTYY